MSVVTFSGLLNHAFSIAYEITDLKYFKDKISDYTSNHIYQNYYDLIVGLGKEKERCKTVEFLNIKDQLFSSFYIALGNSKEFFKWSNEMLKKFNNVDVVFCEQEYSIMNMMKMGTVCVPQDIRFIE